MVMPIDNFDADEILRDQDDDYSFEDDNDKDEEEIQELEFGNSKIYHDLDMSEEDNLFT